MCRGAGLGAEIDAAAAPLLPGVEALARAGVRTGASTRNWESYGEAVRLDPALPAWTRDLLTDPQTSGGLLVSVAPAGVEAVIGLAWEMGFQTVARVGRMSVREMAVEVR